MANIVSIYTQEAAQIGEAPRRVKLITKDSLATITTAGYLRSSVLQGYTIYPTDIIDCWYSYVSQNSPGTYAVFYPSISNGVITLVQDVSEGNVLLPVVSGDFAVYNGTTGQIKDAGYSASNPAKTKVVMANGATVSGNIAVFTDTAGTLDDSSTGSIINFKYGATPVAQVDPASCTITAAAGAANTAVVTVQLKDGSGTNLTYSMPFRVYASSAADGLTLASAASTGFSVASGGLSLANGTAVTTQISCMSSATGGCVLNLLDTGKQTSYLVLVLHNGIKISAQLTAGSYG